MSEGFWIAIFGLAWPLVVIWAFFQFRPLIESLLKRESVNIEIAGFKFSSQEAIEKIGKDIADLQKRLALIESDKQMTKAWHETENAERQERLLLWVDDFPSNNAFLIENFRKQGIEVVLSLSTEDALKKLRSGGFRVVISDLGRQEDGIDNPLAGLELLQSMRELEPRPPIIIFAGSRGLQNKARLLAAGAEDVTSSPIDVVSFVEKHLGS